MAVTVHSGAAEVPGRVRLLDAEALEPGASGWAQVRLDAPLAVLRGDHVILRTPSPAATVGGGRVLAVNPPRHRRHAAAVLERLALQAVATPIERLAEVLAQGPLTLHRPLARANLSALAGMEAFEGLLGDGQIVPLQASRNSMDIAGVAGGQHRGRPIRLMAEKWISGLKGYWTTSAWIAAAADRVREILAAYHARYPLRRGMPLEEVRAAMDWIGASGMRPSAYGEPRRS